MAESIGSSKGSKVSHGSKPEASGEEVLNAVGMIPDDKKRSFLKVKNHSPELIWAELGPMRFLKYCDYDYWKAAEALVSYWGKREELFGERAFLPLSQTGDGALTVEDVMTLHTGKFVLLPKTPKGQEVMFVDRNRVLPTSTTQSKLRALFYMIQQLTKDDVSQTLGCHLIVLLVTPRNTQLDVAFVRGALQLINTFPAKILMHYLLCYPKFGMTPLIQTVVTTAVSYGITNVHGLEIHSKGIGEPILNELREKLGLLPCALPASIGGTWKYENHIFWCRTKTADEQCREAIERSLPKRKKQSKDTENKQDRAKSLNVIHSRLKRERRKAEEEELRQTCDRLFAQNELLKREKIILEKQLRDAQKMVKKLGSSRGAISGTGNLNAAREGRPLHTHNEIMSANANALSNFFYDGTQRVTGRTGAVMPRNRVTPFPERQAANESLLGMAVQHQFPSLSASVDAVINQPPDVQRFLLAALQQRIQRQEPAGTRTGAAPAQAQAHTLLAYSGSTRMPDHSNAQSQTVRSQQLDILSLLSKSQYK